MFPDALSLLLTALFFALTAVATMRRPVYGVCALMFAVPFSLTQIAGFTTFTLLKAAIGAVALGLCVYRGAYRPLLDVQPRRFIVAGALVTAATLLTIVNATYPGAVIRETLKALEYVLVFCLTYAAYRADPDRELVCVAASAVSLLVCLAALSQEFYGAPSALLMNGHATPRIAGPLEGPNQLAGWIDVSLPLLLACAVRRMKGALPIVICILALTAVLTFSRGGIIGAIAGVAALAAVLGKPLLRALVPAAAGAAAGAFVASVWGIVAHTIGLSRFWDLRPSWYAGGAGTRPLLWSAAIRLWREHPLLGVGAGNFERELAATGNPGLHTHANSLYLQSLAEGGVILLVANLWLIAVALWTFAQRAARSPFAAAAFAATIALTAHQTVDLLVFYPKVGAWWWLVLALGAADTADAPATTNVPAAAA